MSLGLESLLLVSGMLFPPQDPVATAPQPPTAAPTIPAAELPQYLDEARKQIKDPRRRPEDRAQFAREAAETLDRAARQDTSTADQVLHWGQAVSILDDFLQTDGATTQTDVLTLQAAVYRWAQGRAWLDQWRRAPGDSQAHHQAAEMLDDAASRLRPLWSSLRATPRDPLAQNARFRLAEALSDRVDLEPPDTVGAGDLRRQALLALDPLPEEPTLVGHATLLKTHLLVGERQLDLAAKALEALPAPAPAPSPPTGAPAGPSPTERLDVQLELLLANHQFHEALAAIAAHPELPAPVRDLREIRVLAEQWINLFPGQERLQIEQKAFQLAASLRQAGAPEARFALTRLAESILEPDSRDDPLAHDLLAEGHLARGNTQRACDLNRRGAALATAKGDLEQAWRLDYRAAAIFFRAGDFTRAAEILRPIAQAARDPAVPAPADQRAKASLLETLCLARLASSGSPSARAAQEGSLRAHLDAFPDDPTSLEARFMLGQILSQRRLWNDSRRLWSQIPPGSSRWLESRLAMAASWRDQILQQRRDGLAEEARVALAEARDFLNQAIAGSQDPDIQAELDLARLEIELIPGVGSPTEALERAENLVRTDIRTDRRDRARRLWIVALAQSNRYVDAEREARALFERSTPRELLDLAARLDASSSIPSDLARRRNGYINRLIAAEVLARSSDLDPATKAEAALRQGRGQIASGDLDGARRTFAGLEPEMASLPTSLVEPWASALADLGLFGEAIDAYRTLGKRYPPGSRSWLEARYGLALSCFRSGQPDQARKLIEGTQALHPDLGGGELREKFLGLKRRLDRKP